MKKDNTKDKRIVMRVEESLYALIEKMAEKEDRTISAIVRKIVKDHFKIK